MKRVALILACVLALPAGVMALVLTAASLSQAGVAGCGPGSSCETVLRSPYARVLGAPVALLAVGVYIVLIPLACRPRPGRFLLQMLAGLLLAAAAYFILLQAVVIQAFCVLCMITHGLGVAVAAALLAAGRPRWKPLVAGAALVALLGAVQFVLPGAAPAASESAIRFADTGPGPGRTLTIAVGDRGARIRPEQLPLLGSAEAPYILVEFFDYTCGFCRGMHRDLTRAQRVFGDAIAVLPVGVPLGACNPHVAQDTPAHRYSCDLQRLALAVWKTDPAAFAAVHDAFFAPDLTPQAARELALEHVDEDTLDETLADPWIDAQLARNATLFAQLGGVLPQLIIGPTHVRGLPPSPGELIALIAEQTGLKPQPPVSPGLRPGVKEAEPTPGEARG